MRHVVSTIILASMLVGCAKQDGLNQYSYKDVGQSTLVEFGTVVSVRDVGITGQNSGAGATAGALAGGSAGYQFGNGNGQLGATIAGAVVGAVAGQAIEQAAADRKGIEYTVTKENGQTVTVVQNMNKEDKLPKNGDRVMVQTSGSYQRVIPADALPEKIKRPKGIKLVD